MHERFPDEPGVTQFSVLRIAPDGEPQRDLFVLGIAEPLTSALRLLRKAGLDGVLPTDARWGEDHVVPLRKLGIQVDESGTKGGRRRYVLRSSVFEYRARKAGGDGRTQ